MAVNMKGGNSGSPGKEFLAPVPKSGESQPVIDTSTSSRPGSVVFASESHREHRHGQHRTPDFMPEGGSINEGSSDVMQQDVNKNFTKVTMNKDDAFNADA